MSDSQETTSDAVAISVANKIQAQVATVEGASGAVVDLVPDFTLEQVTSALKILVTPQAEVDANKNTATRGDTDTEIQTNVAVMQKLSSKNDIPNMIAFCEKIKKALQRKVIAGIGVNTLASISPLYDVNIFKRNRVIISVIMITTKVQR
jgi:hypothetical protein